MLNCFASFNTIESALRMYALFDFIGENAQALEGAGFAQAAN